MTENAAGLPLKRQEKEYIAIRLCSELGPEYYLQGRRSFTMSHPRKVWLDAVVADIWRLQRG